MKAIFNVHLNHGRNAEHFAFHDNVLAVFTPELAAELKIATLRQTYAAAFEKEDQAFKRNAAEERTKEIEEKDKLRDELFVYIKRVVDANLISPMAAQKQAAEKLAYVVNPYRDADKKPYRENTALIKNLLTDLQAADMAANLTALGLAPVVEQLQQANDNFQAVFSTRSDDRLVRDTAEKMKQLRPQVDDAYRAVAEAVNALYAVNELVQHDEQQAQTLGLLIDGINAEVNEYQRALSRRGAGKKPGAGDYTPTEGGGTDTPDNPETPGTGGGTTPDPGTDPTPGTGGNTGGGTGDTGDDFV